MSIIVKKKLIRVYIGADPHINFQYHAFSCEFELHEISRLCRIEYMSHNDAKLINFQHDEIMIWLFEADFHFILCHMHQGQKTNGPWDCSKYLLSLQKLKTHCGYPMAEHLQCPIFTQNKLLYISALSDNTIDTLAIAMPNFYKNNSKKSNCIIYSGVENNIFKWNKVKDTIDRLKHKGYGEEQEWVLKFPFRSNSYDRFFCKDFDSLENKIEEYS